MPCDNQLEGINFLLLPLKNRYSDFGYQDLIGSWNVPESNANWDTILVLVPTNSHQ
uniref:Uncharacterized protein n=1 Tax=Schistosoma haematobium TaxID=6185 RepID=A0A095A5L7_SCHHA